MSTSKQVTSPKVALAIPLLGTLAAATYCVSASKDNTAVQPFEQTLEVSVGVGVAPTTSTGMQALVFAQASYDGGATWQSGPTSGTVSTDEPDLTFIGAVPVKSIGTHTKSFPVGLCYGGIVPPMVRYVVKNDTGVSFTGGSMATSDTTVSSI